MRRDGTQDCKISEIVEVSELIEVALGKMVFRTVFDVRFSGATISSAHTEMEIGDTECGVAGKSC